MQGAFNIGLLHTCLEDGGTDYAPASIANLVARGYEYWALGHTHHRQDLSRDGVHIEFPGNPQGRSIRETGPKGCSLVMVDSDRTVTSRFEPLDTVRWQELSVVSDDSGLEGAVRAMASSSSARLSVSGIGPHIENAPGTGMLPTPVTAEIRQLIASLQGDDGALSSWMAEFSELRGRFAGDLGGVDALQALNEKQAFRALLTQVGGQL